MDNDNLLITVVNNLDKIEIINWVKKDAKLTVSFKIFTDKEKIKSVIKIKHTFDLLIFITKLGIKTIN